MELPIVLEDRTGAPFTVRKYEPADRPALEAMYDGFEPKRGAQGLPPRSIEQIRRWLDRVLPNGEHLIVEIDGRVRGHVMLVPMEPGTVELANFLHQSVRGRGIGTHANVVATQVARERGHRRIWLSVEPSNRAAIRSYEKAGFRQLPGSLWAPEIEMEAILA
ncbi:MAG: GNAT family N-acetyltransferase [Candidatus Cloacimonetes bacterium]|nr:GNAT family N-acetyltransferase [Candidatus Cloacimonadota bacterium]